MKSHEMTKNYIFREFECGFSKEDTAKLCFKSLRQVTEWDRGKLIPPECKRLMRMAKSQELSKNSDWTGFRMCTDKLELPTGQRVSPQEILTGIALLEIQSELEITTTSKLLRYARAIAKIK
ncbi:bacteriophage f237 ORF9 [Vibrio ichthyoenteri ATCC 700023]|uniref:Bacteriophage f237 ORF9 n=1 Tax=Vibrio ichthyoenteri ATCC 700023 TaxID=870968 RepID=F9RY17_9VIBR|nr:phage protein [Vibrio ichthyoenteri]EGU47017.1 bacteriophage f237 ORF9 [Vibrio ichthyoenteri ATCC 700023]